MRASRRGFTLIELMVSMAIGLFIVATTFIFIVHQNRLLEFTKREIDRDRGGRVGMDLLVQDLRHSGLGVGYAPDGSFNGLMLGSFSVPGGAQFNANNQAITVNGELNGVTTNINFVTDDIGVRLSNGSYRTIVQFGGGSAQVCTGGAYEAGDIVMFMSEDTFDARTARISSFSSNVGCALGTCLNGCDQLTYVDDDSYNPTNPIATSLAADYGGGEMAGDYANVVWFVEGGNLRRAEATNNTPCGFRDDTCGQVVAFNVDSVQLQIWQWDADANVWENRTAAQTITDRRRVRLDVEMVVRARGGKQTLQPELDLQLEGVCLPACGVQDDVARRALRVSVEVRNSGRLQLGGVI